MGLIEIKPEYEAAWRAWGATLMGDEVSEALASLKEEALTQETVSLVRIEGRLYLAYLTEGAGLPANLDRAVSARHRELLEQSRIRKHEAETLYDLRTRAHQ